MSKGLETRRTILDHATREAARVGLSGLTIGSLASGLGLSKSGVFAHFSSKEALEAAVIDYAAERFTDEVIRPALRTARGEGRVRALFDGWIEWFARESDGRGCVFVGAASELDDRPGLARDRLVAQQQDWLEFLASVAVVAVKEGQFRADLDPLQFAYEAMGVMFGLHHAHRLLEDPLAHTRARTALERLIVDARA